MDDTPRDAEPRPHDSILDLPLRPLSALDPLRWLRLGWRDFMRAPGIGLFYGACFAAMGWVLLWTYRSAPAWVLALSAGFLLTGPFLCLGLYDASRRLEQGDKPDLGASLIAWESRAGTMAAGSTPLRNTSARGRVSWTIAPNASARLLRAPASGSASRAAT